MLQSVTDAVDRVPVVGSLTAGLGLFGQDGVVALLTGYCPQDTEIAASAASTTKPHQGHGG